MNTELPPIKSVENPEHRLIETVFLPAKLTDNPALTERDPEYEANLWAQGERLARALLDGDWSVFAGQFLPEFNYHTHTCEWFEPPRKWTRFRGYDWGFAAPCAMLWYAVDSASGRLYQYQELYEVGLTDPQQAERINKMSPPSERYAFSYADPAVWTKRTTEVIAKSTFDIFLEHGIYLTKADNNQERKAKRLRSALAPIHDGKPGLMIMRNCVNTITEFEGLMSDPDWPERPLTRQQDHAYDASCYALTNYMPPMVVNFRKNNTQYKSPYLEDDGI